MKYIGSIVAFNNQGHRFNHSVAMMEADSSDEAHGKGLRLAKNVFYPESEGYFNHSVTFVTQEELKESLESSKPS